MDFLIFSDSHGRTGKMREALERQPTRPAAIIYLGDGLRDLNALELGGIPLYAVRGNCDSFLADTVQSYPEEYLTDLGGHTALITHGANYGVKGGLGALISAAARRDAEIALFGHTHRAHEEVIPAGTRVGEKLLTRPMYLFNPGSIGQKGEFGTLTVRGRDLLFSHGTI